MSKRVCVIDVPGLSHELLAELSGNSSLRKWLPAQSVRPLTPSWPMLTCSVQATLTTGVPPSRHGIVANGIATFRSPEDQRLIDASSFANYRRAVSFWEQSNQLVEAPRFWTGKFKTALLFCQNSMPGFVEPPEPAADIVVTPKPEHGPDGKITSLIWTEPRELVGRLFKQLGPFPLMNYWGPLANINSSRWIAQAAAMVWHEFAPQLQFVYVPHLDYDLQRFGPESQQAQQAVRDFAGVLDPLIDSVLSERSEIVLLSEYAMRSVTRSVRPNLMLREAGLLLTHDSEDGQLVDYAKSRAFAMCDHQIAHIYLQNESAKRAVIETLPKSGMMPLAPSERQLNHRRAGHLILEAEADTWLDYRWWRESSGAPPFARTVDIHRKPGYDPLELFFDPASGGTSQDPSQVHGSHGIVQAGEAVIAGNLPAKFDNVAIQATDVAAIVTDLLAR